MYPYYHIEGAYTLSYFLDFFRNVSQALRESFQPLIKYSNENTHIFTYLIQWENRGPFVFLEVK